jgi:hypothetical protein
MISECICCLRTLDTRLGTCFDCAESESILIDGTDMYDKSVPQIEGLSISLSRVRAILNKFGVITRAPGKEAGK